MKVPYSWLTEYCDPGLSAEEIGEALSMHCIELERISHLGAPSAEGFVVGRVISAEQHPNADRLRVCEVDDRRTAPGRSSAGRPTWPPARRSRSPSRAP